MTVKIGADHISQNREIERNRKMANDTLNPYEDLLVQEVVDKFEIKLFLMKKELPKKVSEASNSARKQLAQFIKIAEKNG